MSDFDKPLWALGLMSGTSADGIDAALIQTDGHKVTTFGVTHFKPYPKDLKKRILKASGRPPGAETGDLTQEITQLHAQVVEEILEKSEQVPEVIGFHGQTIFHKPPQKKGEIGETYILADGDLLAETTGIPVIDQMRLNDISQGGQGAPLVPVFHQALTEHMPKPLAFLNIGGVANVTWIGEGKTDLVAFDTGPGNGLIDDVVQSRTTQSYDEEGKLACKGSVNLDLINKWIDHSYFKKAPPKSLDRRTFTSCIDDVEALSLEDACATLTAFTIASVQVATKHFPQPAKLWLVAGGGAHNKTMLRIIEGQIEGDIKLAEDFGFAIDSLEAQAFAFLAVRSLRKLPLTFPKTTGAPSPLTGGRLSMPVNRLPLVAKR